MTWWMLAILVVIFFIGFIVGFVLGYEKQVNRRSSGSLLLFSSEEDEPNIYLQLDDYKSIADDFVLLKVERDPQK